jgi:uncharacterized membrane protein
LSLLLLCRVLHIAATCTSLGGLFYARMVLWPTLDQLPDSERERFLEQIIRRFAYIKWTGVIVVAATGVIQWLWTYPYVLDQTSYLVYFGIKMIGAIGLFSITFLLALPVDKLHGMQKRRAIWSGLNIICGLTILVGAALMRTVARGQ